MLDVQKQAVIFIKVCNKALCLGRTKERYHETEKNIPSIPKVNKIIALLIKTNDFCT